jgi:tetratricopeptide (TPR) repeat protein
VFTEEVTADLSRIAHMFVISRSTAFTYRDRRVDSKQLGRELGVRYLLEGSVRRSGNRVRVNAQLVDAETNADLWAERFDGDTIDLFELQNEITSRIAKELGGKLIAAEAARPTEHPDALDYILRGRYALSKPETVANLDVAANWFERALALDARSVEAQSWLASVLAMRVLSGKTDTRAADIARAEELIGQALAASPRSPLVHSAKAHLMRVLGQFEEAISEFETVIGLDPNATNAIADLGAVKLATGPIEETIPLEEKAIRLSPRDARVDNWYDWIGRAHLLQSRTDEAIPWLERARCTNPQSPFHHAFLASAYGLRGDTDRAVAELAEARRLVGDDRFSSMAKLKRCCGKPAVRALYENTYFAGLRKAEMPEE